MDYSTYIFWAIIIVIIIVLILLWNRFTKNIIQFLIDLCMRIELLQEPVKSILFSITLVLVQLSFIPLQSTLAVLIAIILGNFIHCVIIIVSTSLLASVISYIISTKCCADRLKRAYKDKPLFKLILEEGKISPYRTAFLVRILFVPLAFKDYLLPLSGMGFLPYFSMAIPFAVLFAVIFTFIGIQLRMPEDLLNPRDFGNQTSAEKFNSIFTYFVFFISFVIVVSIGCLTRYKLKEIEEKDKKRREQEQQEEGQGSDQGAEKPGLENHADSGTNGGEVGNPVERNNLDVRIEPYYTR